MLQLKVSGELRGVSVIMKAHKDGTCSPEPLAVSRRPEPRTRFASVSSCDLSDASSDASSSDASSSPPHRAAALEPWEEQNLLKSLKYKMSTRKEEIFVNSKDTNREGKLQGPNTPVALPPPSPTRHHTGYIVFSLFL